MTPIEPSEVPTGVSGRDVQSPALPPSTGDVGTSKRGERERPRGRSPRGWIVAALLGALVVAMAVVVVILIGNGDDTKSTTSTVRYSERFESNAVEPLAGRSLVAVGAKGHHEPPTWSTPVGAFVVLDGTTAGGLGTSASTPSLGVVQPSGKLLAVSGRLDPAKSGLGFVFRYRDPRNYWSLLPMPGFATWNIYNTVNGHAIFKGNTGFSSFGDARVEIKLAGNKIDVRVAGGKKQTLTSPIFAEARGVGLIAFTGADSPGRCTEFDITEAS
jgi:hypothetical protein